MAELDTSGIDRAKRDAHEAAAQWLNGFTEDVATTIQLSFDTSPPGLMYDRGQGRIHIASQPGFPPNIDMGNLINSIHQEQTGDLEHTVFDGTEYGIWVEDGTEAMAARPFMRPIFDEARQTFEREAAEYIRRWFER